MCRQMLMIGSGKNFNYARSHLVRSLIDASRNDPHSKALFGPHDASHPDGWGLVRVILTSQDVERILVERSLKPIYNDRESALLFREEIMPEEIGIVEMIHARAATSGIVSARTTHPIELDTRSGYKLFLIHNGSVNKMRILRELGIDESSDYAKVYSDTFFLAQLIASLIESDLNENILRHVARHTETALNIGVLLIKDKEIQVMAGSYYKTPDKPIERRNYYKIYKSSIDDMIIYVSSTLIDHYKPELELKWIELPNGFFEIYRVWFDKRFRIEKIREFNLGYEG